MKGCVIDVVLWFNHATLYEAEAKIIFSTVQTDRLHFQSTQIKKNVDEDRSKVAQYKRETRKSDNAKEFNGI